MEKTEQEILDNFCKPTMSLTMFNATKGELSSNYDGRPCHVGFNLAIFNNVKELEKLGVFLNKLSDCHFVYKDKGPVPTSKTPELFAFVKKYYFGADSPWKEVCNDVEFIEHPEHKYWYIRIDFEGNPNFKNYSTGHVALLANFVVALRNIFESSNKTRNMVTLVNHGVPFRRAIVTSALFSYKTFESSSKGTLMKMSAGTLNPAHWFTGYEEPDSFFCGKDADLKTASKYAQYHTYDSYLWPKLRTDYFQKMLDFMLENVWTEVQRNNGILVKGRFGGYRVYEEPKEGKSGVTVAELANYIKEYPNA